MGLEIIVGIYSSCYEEEEKQSYERQFKAINCVLDRYKLPHHDEPEQPVIGRSRALTDGFSYGDLHLLRGYYAFYQIEERPPEPLPDSRDPSRDSYVEDISEDMISHLVVHSDCAGYYLPQALPEILFDLKDNPVVPVDGCMIGSAVALQEELALIAEPLGITLTQDETLSDEAATQIIERIKQRDPFAPELLVWLCLFEAARLSRESGSAIVFR